MRERLKILAGREGFVYLRPSAGQAVRRPVAGRHSHAEVEMNLVLHGSGRYLVRYRPGLSGVLCATDPP